MEMEGWGSIEVELTGITPLLMYNPASMTQAKTGVQKLERIKPEEEAERGCYWSTTTPRQLIITSHHVKSTMIVAAKAIRTAVGRRSVAPFIAGQVRIHPYEISLGTDKYVVDIARVVNRTTKGSILRARPKVWPWAVTFTLRYHQETFQNTDVLRNVLDRAGLFVGFLEYRPAKYGEFGQFKVTRWDVQP